MLPALALLAAAAAAEPSLAEVRSRYPYRLEIAGQDKRLHLLDLDGRIIPTPDALVLVGLPEAAASYRKAERTRRGVANGIWIGAAVLGASSVLFAPGVYDEDGQLLAATVQYIVPVAIGAGFAVRYVNPRRHLGAWTDEATVVRGVTEHELSLGDGPSSLEVRTDAYEARQIFIDYDGTVVDAERRPVKMSKLALLLPDDAIEDEYRRTRRIDRTVWSATLGAGGGIALLGGSVAILGLIPWALNGDPTISEVGAVGFLVGMGGVGTGLTGMFVSRALHENPARWYSEPELRERLDAHDRHLREELGLVEARRWDPPSIQVQPVLGVGMVGLVGTF